MNMNRLEVATQRIPCSSGGRIEETASFSELDSCFSAGTERSKGSRHPNKVLPREKAIELT